MQFDITLLRRIRGFAGQLTSLAKSYAPNHLQSGISTSVEEKQSGNIRIKITAKGDDAHAQEYGSGLRVDRRVGSPHYIKIFPVNGKALVFLGTNGYGNEYSQYNPNTKQGIGGKNIVVTPQVLKNPGIEKYKGRGYLAPAVKEFRNVIKGKDLSADLKKAILSDIKKAFETGETE